MPLHPGDGDGERVPHLHGGQGQSQEDKQLRRQMHPQSIDGEIGMAVIPGERGAFIGKRLISGADEDGQGRLSAS